MPYCRDCGKEVKDEWKLCPFCGSTQSNSENNDGNSESTSNSGIDFTDSAMSGDIHHTVINNDVEAVTNAVLMALDRLGVVKSEPSLEAPAELVPPEMTALSVGEVVDYYSPTNNRWLDACEVIAVNDDGTYDVTVPKTSRVETKYGVVIGDSPGTIRPAIPLFSEGDRVLGNWRNAGAFYMGTIVDINSDGTYDIQYDDGDAELKVDQSCIFHAPQFSIGDRVFANWKAHGYYFPGHIGAIHPDHTMRIDYDDGDVEDDVPLSRIRIIPEDDTQMQEYAESLSEAEEEILDAFRVFDPEESGTISAAELFRILTAIGDDPINVDEVHELFDELGISMDAELDYRQLAKWLVSH